MPAALSPLPAGPVSPSSAREAGRVSVKGKWGQCLAEREVSETPGAMLSEKAWHAAVGQDQWYHFGVGAPPILLYFSGDWDVHTGTGFGPMAMCSPHVLNSVPFFSRRLLARRMRGRSRCGPMVAVRSSCCAPRTKLTGKQREGRLAFFGLVACTNTWTTLTGRTRRTSMACGSANRLRISPLAFGVPVFSVVTGAWALRCLS